MKKLFLLSFASLALCVAISSCDNGAYTATPGQTSNTTNPIATNSNNGSGSNNGGTNNSSTSFAADINGSHFTATYSYYSDTMTMFTIYGVVNPTDPSNYKAISIILPNSDDAVGTYDISNKAEYINGTSVSNLHTATSGNLTITSKQNNKIQGTFHFSAGSGYEITNGTFNLNKQ